MHSAFVTFRYRGSTDDLRRSREDISLPSLIPKLLSSRSKEERLKRQDSKDDIRHSSKSSRKDSKEETKSSSLIASPSANKDDGGCKASGIRIFRRDNSREDVGRESANSIGSAKGKQQDKTQERTEDRSVGSATRSRAVGEQNRTKCEDGKDAVDVVEESSCKESVIPIERDETTRDKDEITAQADVEIVQDAGMVDVIVAEDRTQNERQEQDTMVVGEVLDEKHLLAREPIESTSENDKQDDDETRDTAERLLDGSDGDVTGIAGERRSLLEIGYGKRLDEFQVVSEYGRSWA